MRILHVTPYMHPSAGGPPVVVENFVSEATLLGHSSEIVSTSLFCLGDDQDLLHRLNELAPTIFVGRSGKTAPVHWPTRRQLNERIRAADIVHLHTLWNPINIVVRQACKSFGRPYVLMPHGMLDPYSLRAKRWRKALYFRAFERRNILSAERLIYTTAEEARLATTELPFLPQGVVVPLGGGAPDEGPGRLASAFLEAFPRARDRRQLLFLGRLHFKKGLDRIIKVLPSVVRRFPDVLLTIAGDGDPSFEKALRSEIAARELQNNVMMTGRLDGTLKWGAYASARLFLLPSRQENFAITVAEAMQMGVPVIISNKVNTWPCVKAADAGFVLDESEIENSLEAAILSLLQHEEAMKRYGTRGREYARKNMTWTEAAKRVIECYSEILGSGRSHPRSR
jgi:glycosyltransferase involved in cell wall biosynthesis